MMHGCVTVILRRSVHGLTVIHHGYLCICCRTVYECVFSRARMCTSSFYLAQVFLTIMYLHPTHSCMAHTLIHTHGLHLHTHVHDILTHILQESGVYWFTAPSVPSLQASIIEVCTCQSYSTCDVQVYHTRRVRSGRL